MPAVSLPQDPNLGQLRKQARELQRSVRSGDAAALALIAEFHPRPPAAGAFPLAAAQLTVARRHGFPSWARLRQHIAVLTARNWTPGTPPPPDEPLPDAFLRLACLTYSDDTGADQAAAARLLAEHPELPSASLAVAAACADVPRVRQFLAADPSLASAVTGPHGWSPLLYQAYARHDPQLGAAATRQTARLLLEAGADPNDGRFWHGLPTPFTVLTGVLGGGEQDQPPHPAALPFARLLLEAGADPNDGQAVYDGMFSAGDDHLVLLLEFGLGRPAGGPWHQLLGDALESPPVMLRNLLWWAVTHDQRQRVALLAASGVDVVAPFAELRMDAANGRTPAQEALLSGHRELAAQLVALGAAEPRLDPVDEFVAGVLAGDADAVRRAGPAAARAARRQRPGLVTWAAGQGAPDAVPLLVTAGFDVNSYGRSDVPLNQPWQTALHVAAETGNLDLARRLLELGADPQLKDRRFGGTPLDWSQHFGHQPLTDLLEPLTEP